MTGTALVRQKWHWPRSGPEAVYEEAINVWIKLNWSTSEVESQLGDEHGPDLQKWLAFYGSYQNIPWDAGDVTKTGRDSGSIVRDRCAHCGKKGRLIPIGFAANPIWMHGDCQPVWSAKRGAAAVAAYARAGIHPPKTAHALEAAE
jgi:hypothetical protein